LQETQQKILVTGGAGFIGSHLVEKLLADGWRVVVLDNFDSFYDPAIKRRNVAEAERSPDYSLIEGDIRDEDLLSRLFAAQKFDAVIHLAARAGVRPSIEDPALYTSVNLDGTTRLLEACRLNNVKRFIFGSSSSVYGNNRKVPFAEDDPVDHPISPYAATKKAGELLCYSQHHLFGLKVACLRFFTVYGPRQRPEMAIHKFTRLLSEGKKIQQFGDGTSARDYTFVADIVSGICRALECCHSYHIWNLGGSNTIQLGDLTSKIADGLKLPLQLDVLPLQPGDVDRTWADTTKAEQELGWKAQIDIDLGLKKFLDWYAKMGVGSHQG
jgi:UDP-glucuronate 4-epimerase